MDRRSFSLIVVLLGACISLKAADRTVRLTVAHQHFGSWCLGYLYVDPDEVRFEVVKPERYKDHAFRVQRSQITMREWVVMGQPQNVSEIKFGRATNHLWLLPDLDLASVPNLPMPQSIALPFQYLIAVIAAGGKPAPASPAATATAQRRPPSPVPAASAPSNPETSLGEAMRSVEAYQLHFRQTGDLPGMPAALGPARDKAQTAYGQFLAKRDYAKAAQSLIKVADIDRMLTMVHPEESQARQAPIHQQYADALKLADQANDAAMQFKAVMGLSRRN